MSASGQYQPKEIAVRKILIPYDGSENALRAVRFAASMARQLSAVELELLYVQDRIPLKMHASFSSHELERRQADEGNRVLQPAREALDSEGVIFQARCRSGAPADEIARHADETQCDAIIMGTRGLGPVAGVILGSVAARVVQQVDIPVTLIK